MIQSGESTHDEEIITAKNAHNLAIILGIEYYRY